MGPRNDRPKSLHLPRRSLRVVDQKPTLCPALHRIHDIPTREVRWCCLSLSLQLLSSRSIGEVILPSSLSSYTNMSRQRIEFSQLTPNRCLRRCRSVLVGVQDETLRITNSACYSKNNVAEKMESKTQQTKASHRTCRRDAGVGASIQAAQVIEMQSMGALRAAGSMV